MKDEMFDPKYYAAFLTTDTSDIIRGRKIASKSCNTLEFQARFNISHKQARKILEELTKKKLLNRAPDPNKNINFGSVSCDNYAPSNKLLEKFFDFVSRSGKLEREPVLRDIGMPHMPLQRKGFPTDLELEYAVFNHFYMIENFLRLLGKSNAKRPVVPFYILWVLWNRSNVKHFKELARYIREWYPSITGAKVEKHFNLVSTDPYKFCSNNKNRIILKPSMRPAVFMIFSRYEKENLPYEIEEFKTQIST